MKERLRSLFGGSILGIYYRYDYYLPRRPPNHLGRDLFFNYSNGYRDLAYTYLFNTMGTTAYQIHYAQLLISRLRYEKAAADNL